MMARQLATFIRKEFLHVLRDRRTLLILFGLPIVQILLFGFALTNEVRNALVLVVDDAHDDVSRVLIGHLADNPTFVVQELPGGHADVEAAFRSTKARAIVVFPDGFRRELSHGGRTSMQVLADASDPNLATSVTTIITAIVQDYQRQTLQEGPLPYTIDVETRMLYNPELRGAPNFVPGVMAMVLMLICVMMTSIAIVREKELGTMELLLVSPFRPILVIVAKVVPYLLLSIINVVSIVALSVVVLDLPVAGSVTLLLAVSVLFILTCLSLGLLISTITSSQQAAMLISMMGMLLPTVLFSGFMFPIENMPIPLQAISNLVPARWYYGIVKAIMIKGLGITAIGKDVAVLAGMTVVLTIVSLRKFSVRLG